MSEQSKVQAVYAAEDLDQQRDAYDDWAASYEPEICAMGYRIPALISGLFARYVPADASPILDAGCGGGIQAEPLALMGYGPLIGIDLSEGMLAIAREKQIYSQLHTMTLGEHLDFPSDHFEAVVSSGTITQYHAPPHSFDELVRVAKPGAMIIFTLRCDPGIDPAYAAHIEKLEAQGKWRNRFSTAPVKTMPYGEPDVLHKGHVFEVL